jgi:hypothetical protein
VRILKQIADLYIAGSIHVATACAALTLMTQHMFELQHEPFVVLFAFFGTIIGYNFVKYDALARKGKGLSRLRIRAFAYISMLSFFGALYSFLNLRLETMLCALAFMGITLLYTLPFFPNRRNARNWAGVKIYMVALCWVGVTVLLPLIDQMTEINLDYHDVVIKCIQRFVLIFVLVLIFEIVDLRYDDPHLKTVPQQIGVRRTKVLGIALLLLFYCLEFAKHQFNNSQLAVNLILLLMTTFFIVRASEHRSRYFASLWVESIPIIWWLLVVALN